MMQNFAKPEGEYSCHVLNDAGETNHRDAISYQLLRQRKLRFTFCVLKLFPNLLCFLKQIATPFKVLFSYSIDVIFELYEAFDLRSRSNKPKPTDTVS